MRRTMIIILSAIIALLTIHPPYAKAAESYAKGSAVSTPTRTTPASYKARTQPLMARMVDCEDYDIQPCYTYDDGAWRMVLSYSPYKAAKLHRCTEEDASAKGQKFPCIWKDNNRVKKGQPVTRNVFTKNG